MNTNILRLKRDQFESRILSFAEQFSKTDSGFHRFYSWEHCYFEFQKARFLKNKKELMDFLALHLSMYLASWGMYRGSSFMLELDYKVNIEIVEILRLYDQKYNLMGLDILKLNDKAEEIANLVQSIKDSYVDRLETIEKTDGRLLNVNPTDTLITKIILGTLGCTIAYDSYVKNCLKMLGISQSVTIKGMQELGEVFAPSVTWLEEIRKKNKYLKKYPDLKLIDMYLFKSGNEG